MKKRHAFIAAVAATVLAIGIAPTPASAEPENLEEVEAELKERGEALEAVIEDYNGAKEDLKETEKRIKEIEKSLPKLEEEAAASREHASNIAVAAYTGQKQLSVTGTILDGSPSNAIERITTLGAINAAQAADLESFLQASTSLEEEKESLESIKIEQKALKEKLQGKKDEIEADMADLDELKRQYTPPTNDFPDVPPPPDGNAGVAVQFAYDQLGEPYQWGAAGPNSWDCSGLTMGAWNAAGVSLAHQASQQYYQVTLIGRDQLAPGDLVFYNNLNHVGIYVGDGQIVHAPTSGQNVSVASVDSMPIDGYGRP